MHTYIPNKDRHGYYAVGDSRTYSKLEAVTLSGKLDLPMRWVFNNEVFDKFNWTHEPEGTLEHYYKIRAQQIRDRYDYLVIWYSGGADSHNMLMSFVRNNIFVDEIAQFHNLSADNGNKNTYFNQEVFYTSAPNTQALISNNPVYRHTKHRLVDVTDIQAKVIQNDSNKWDYFYKVSFHPTPSALSRSYLREMIPDYASLIERKKTVCFVWGIEKPMLEKINDDWFIIFKDMIDNAVSPRTQMLNRDWEHDEFFYWTPDLPHLPAKQAHIVMRFLQQLSPQSVDNINISSHIKLNDEYGRRVINSFCADISLNGRRYQLLPDGLHRLIYPDWRPGAIVAGKPISLTFPERDTWMFNSMAPNLGQKYYCKGILHLRQIVKNANPDYWWEHKYDPKTGLPFSGGIKPSINRYRLNNADRLSSTSLT
jgi:hypothetical protein